MRDYNILSFMHSLINNKLKGRVTNLRKQEKKLKGKK
jgi:hypothetical protein